jgi:hypothetical protein
LPKAKAKIRLNPFHPFRPFSILSLFAKRGEASKARSAKRRVRRAVVVKKTSSEAAQSSRGFTTQK